MKHVEADLQKACVRWFRLQYPQYSKNLFANPNGGSRRGPIEGANLKAQGVTAGVWDLFLMVPKGEYHGLWIEMKVHPNKLTPEQCAFESVAIGSGYYCQVCYTFEYFTQIVSNYLNLPDVKKKVGYTP